MSFSPEGQFDQGAGPTLPGLEEISQGGSPRWGGRGRQPDGSYLSREPAGHRLEERQPQGPWLGGCGCVKSGHSFLLSSHKGAGLYRMQVVLL